MAEVHLIGQLVGATGFHYDRSLFAKWTINAGANWTPLEGFTQGQTHLALANTSIEPRSVGQDSLDLTDDWRISTTCHSWSHPIDVHFACKGLQGWPKLELQLWAVDWLGKCNISAYGFLGLPARPGRHRLTCSTWRPVGDLRRRLLDQLTGYRMQLVDPSDVISNGLNRHHIQADSMGDVQVDLTVVLRNFRQYGVDLPS